MCLLDIIWFLECSTTASSDDKQEFEDVSEEDEPSFHDTKEYFNEPNVGSGSNLYNSGHADIKRRTKLPDPAEKEKGVSLWSMIKDNVGKDLTRVCLPVYFNEPISSLQKCFEDLEYSNLLDRAYEHGKSVSDSKVSYLYCTTMHVNDISIAILHSLNLILT